MISSIRCKLCGEFSAIKSNQGIAEELDRLLSAHLPLNVAHCCSNELCSNVQRPVEDHPEVYYPHGQSSNGARRYRCRLCGTTFSIKAKATFKQKKPEINEIVFRLLMNKMPMRRICETVDIHPATLYGKIDYIYRQCLVFVSNQERRIRDTALVQRLYLSVDRQEYVFNWGTQLDRRNVMLRAIGSADNVSGYVFGMHLDFDESLDGEFVEKAAIAAGDYDQQYAYRRYARLWLQRDYEDSHRLQKRMDAHRSRGTINDAKASEHLKKLECLRERERSRQDGDIDADIDTKAPAVGMQVRSEYTMYAHLFYLRDLLGNIEKTRFFMDQEPGIKAAFSAVFKKEIFERRVDAFLVSINKDMSIDDKKQAKARSEGVLAKVMREHPSLSRHEATILEMRKLIAQATSGAEGKSIWVRHPFPDMGEPEKSACYLTDFGDYDPNHLANMYLKASLRSIDRFFMQIRRRMSIFERPISSASGQKTWHGYSAYNPAIGVKLLAIFRVFYNYVMVGEDKQTPAMRLGIMNRPTGLADILEFLPNSTVNPAPQESSKRKDRGNSGSTKVMG